MACRSGFGNCGCYNGAPSVGGDDGIGDTGFWWARFTWLFRRITGPDGAWLFLVDQPIIRFGGTAFKPRTSYNIYPAGTVLHPFPTIRGGSFIDEGPGVEASGTIVPPPPSALNSLASPVGSVFAGGPIDRPGRVFWEVIATPGVAFSPPPVMLMRGFGFTGSLDLSGSKTFDSGNQNSLLNFDAEFSIAENVYDHDGYPDQKTSQQSSSWRLTMRISFQPPA